MCDADRFPVCSSPSWPPTRRCTSPAARSSTARPRASRCEPRGAPRTGLVVCHSPRMPAVGHTTKFFHDRHTGGLDCAHGRAVVSPTGASMNQHISFSRVHSKPISRLDAAVEPSSPPVRRSQTSCTLGSAWASACLLVSNLARARCARDHAGLVKRNGGWEIYTLWAGSLAAGWSADTHGLFCSTAACWRSLTSRWRATSASSRPSRSRLTRATSLRPTKQVRFRGGCGMSAAVNVSAIVNLQLNTVSAFAPHSRYSSRPRASQKKFLLTAAVCSASHHSVC